MAPHLCYSSAMGSNSVEGEPMGLHPLVSVGRAQTHPELFDLSKKSVHLQAPGKKKKHMYTIKT